MLFDVGEDANVMGSYDDPVGLVGARVNVVWHTDPDGRWARGLYPCVVDAFAAGRKAYVISWVKDRSEHHLKSSQHMADLARQRQSAAVRQKLQGGHDGCNGRCVPAGSPIHVGGPAVERPP